jgi:hypothetical protein
MQDSKRMLQFYYEEFAKLIQALKNA